MQAGPLHLFWATGVFYFWELKSRFDFVLLVTENYRQSAQFQKLIGLPEILHVDYAPTGGRLAAHRHYATRYAEILVTYQPHSALLYNQSYPDNLYLAHFCRKLCGDAKRYCFQLGRMPVNWEADFSAANAEAIARIAGRHSFLKRFRQIAAQVVALKNRLGFGIDYSILPDLLLGIRLHPPLNVYNGDVNAGAMRVFTTGSLDFQLVYSEREMAAYRRLGTGNLQLIRHPAFDVGSEVFQFLYGDYAIKNCILLLPSYGFTSRLLQEGWSQGRVIDHISRCWANAIDVLLAKYPGYDLKIKLHPASKKDLIWLAVVENLVRRFDELAVIEVGASAEWHIAQAWVVVGDVTSALWWAAMYGGRTVISLDIFGYPGGNDMKHDAGIHYFSSIEELGQFNKAGKCGYSPPEKGLSDVICA